MNKLWNLAPWSARKLLAIGIASMLVLSACSPSSSPSGNNGGGGTNPNDNGSNGGGGGGGGGGGTDTSLLNDALGYDGTVSGTVSDTQTTSASLTSTSSAQTVPSTIDFSTVTLRFYDLGGNPLLDENGNAIPDAQLAADGSFTVTGLPVGVDFTICCDIESDGTCDLNSCTNIPSTDGTGTGEATDVNIDPLTTLILAKLQEFMNTKDIDPADLPISPVALVTRVEEAYEHLYEETGIEDEVVLEDIDGLNAQEQAELFDDEIPSGAQAGMLVVDGNLDLVKAVDVNEAALGAAKVFLLAGFPIADAPDGLDLTPLASIEGVEAKTMSQLRPPPAEGGQNTEPAPAQAQPQFDPTVYVYELAEPDRNQPDDENAEGDQGPHLPVIHDFLLLRMAQFQLDHRQITLDALHDLAVSIADGMGVRLQYHVQTPGFQGPPLAVFQTADGKGTAIDLQPFFQQMMSLGLGGASPEEIQQKQAELRALLEDLLSETTEPSFEALTGGFVMNPVPSAAGLAEYVRGARAHLPFSRTGPATFYVIADADSFQSDAANPVTVDAEVSPTGEVLSVTYNSEGTGKFYLNFTEGTQGEGIVSLMVRELGRPLHGRRGPIRLNMHDDDLFAPVNGEPFIEFVSDTGNFLPGINLSVTSVDFVPQAPPPGSAGPAPIGGGTPIATAEDLPTNGQTHQIFVLATQPGPGAQPVHVNYDFGSGVATYSEGGTYVLQFIPETQDTGVFMLVNEQTGRPASSEDPTGFFAPPPPLPEGFEDLYNSVDDFGDLGPIDNLDDFIDDYNNGQLPVPGLQPPPQDPNNPSDPANPTDPNDPVLPAEDTTGAEPTTPPEFGGEVNLQNQILVTLEEIQGLPVARETFTHVFGIEVANPRYNPDGDPYYDDVDGDLVQDADEITVSHRPTLFNPTDWRSTDVRSYYRRADDNGPITHEDVDFASDTPMTKDGVALVARTFIPRMNAFRFGRPNTATNLLTAFMPPEFFNGTYALDGGTSLNVYAAIAVLNLMLDQSFNVEAQIDFDGFGPAPAQNVLVDAHTFFAPVGDPFVLLLNGFESRSTVVLPPVEDASTDTNATTDATTTDPATTPLE